MTIPGRPRVVIIGAGFAGLWAARALSHSQTDVLVLDRNNYHTFFPLLYQVAAAELEAEDIVYRLSGICRDSVHGFHGLHGISRKTPKKSVLFPCPSV